MLLLFFVYKCIFLFTNVQLLCKNVNIFGINGRLCVAL